ncbi:MAG: hypothetical protein OWT27_06850 [Firmicutes bacterium]|nr:hypothetical protein [Bacillota bacterium]
MNVWDMQTAWNMGGAFTAEGASAIGEFDAMHGYVGGIAVVGDIGLLLAQAGGALGAARQLRDVGQAYQSAYPGGYFSWSFSNAGASASAGLQAARIQEFVSEHMIVFAPFFDAEASYASADATIAMANAYVDAAGDLLADIAFDTSWTCAQMQAVLACIGGAQNALPQLYCGADAQVYAACGMSEFLGVTAYVADCGASPALAYQGAIASFSHAFAACPAYVIANGGFGNGLDARLLTCD